MDKLELGHYYQMGQKAYWLLVLERAGSALVVLLIAFIFRGSIGSEAFAQHEQIFNIVSTFLFFISVVFFIFSIIVSNLEYHTTRVMMNESSFHVVKGILNKEEISMPYRRIQSIEIKQPILFRIIGLGRVVISTTTDIDDDAHGENENNDEVIKIMDYNLARLIQKTIVSRAEVERIEVKK